MLTKTTPIFITQYIGPVDSTDLRGYIECLKQEYALVPDADKASAVVSGLSALRMGYVKTLSPSEEAIERHAEAIDGIKALRNVPPENVSKAIEALLLQLDRTEI